MPKKRPEDSPPVVHVWGATEGIDTRLRKLTDEVRALRQKIAETGQERHRLATARDRRLPKPAEGASGKPNGPTKKR